MSCARGVVVSVLLAASLLASACGDPPEKEMQQAQGAIDAARAVGADQYAHAELTAAQEALKRARDAVDQRDYQAALNLALDSRERAQNAAKEAADRKATARGDADKALAEGAAALSEARVKLKAAENARASARLLAQPRRTIADGEQALQEARAAFQQGDYHSVTDVAGPVTSRLRATARDLEAAAAPASRRRR